MANKTRLRYEIEFLGKRGCPPAVLEDMARYDSATVLNTNADSDCSSYHCRRATLLGSDRPTMARWASFGIGARLVGEVTEVRL